VVAIGVVRVYKIIGTDWSLINWVILVLIVIWQRYLKDWYILSRNLPLKY
jgi:hypothetical protein